MENLKNDQALSAGRMSPEEFEKLPLNKRIQITCEGTLIKYFKSIEQTGILPKDKAAKLIGSVKKLSSLIP